MKAIKKTLYPIKLIHNIIEVSGLPFRFSEELILRRATEKEIENFRRVLVNNPNLFPVETSEGIPLYELIYEEKVFPNNKRVYHPKKLPLGKFRYWVFEDWIQENDTEDFDVLALALKLLDFEITLSYHDDLNGGGTYDPRELFQQKDSAHSLLKNDVKQLTKRDFEELIPMINGLIKIKGSSPFLVDFKIKPS